MAQIQAIITALEASEQHKALAAELRTDFASLLEVDSKEAATRAIGFARERQRAEEATTQVADLTAQVKKLGEDVKGVDDLRAKAQEAEKRIAGYEQEQKQRLISEKFTARAKELKVGLREGAEKSALSLADLSGVSVDLKAGEVSGLSAEFFSKLKKEHPVCFAGEGERGSGAPPTIPPLPPGGGGGASQNRNRQPGLKIDEIEGPIGHFIRADG